MSPRKLTPIIHLGVEERRALEIHLGDRLLDSMAADRWAAFVLREALAELIAAHPRERAPLHVLGDEDDQC